MSGSFPNQGTLITSFGRDGFWDSMGGYWSIKVISWPFIINTSAQMIHPPFSFLSGEFIFLDCFQQVHTAFLPEIEGDDKQYQAHWLWLHEATLVEKK